MPEVCTQCSEPLEWTLDPPSPDEDDDHDTSMNDVTDPQTVPDDVRLPCGDHFHWECLLSAYELSHCPHCSADITSPAGPHPPHNDNSNGNGSGSGSSSSGSNPTPQILVDLHNEGGQQTGIDIFPLLQEESYLRAYPDERKARAFLELCREGDHRAIVELLQTCNSTPSSPSSPSSSSHPHPHPDSLNDNESHDPSSSPSPNFLTPSTILRYQDPLHAQQSGLHAAAAGGHREVAWLLLLLGSRLSELEFPALVYQEAAAMGIMRGQEEAEGTAGPDLRSLRDAFGRTAEDVAREEGGVVWNGWIGKGRLAMPG